MGEDIVLTYEILNKKLASTYEPSAVGYTKVTATFDGLYNQRKRWAIGMIEGLSFIPPWKQTGFYPKFFTTIQSIGNLFRSSFFIWIYSRELYLLF